MFFRKKEEELSDQFAVYRKRGAPRWGSPQYKVNAGIAIDGFDGEGQVGNVSITGCSMMSVTYIAIMPDHVYQAKIIPDAGENMEPFSLKVKVNWTKSSETLFQAGFSLESGQDNTHLKRYVDQLQARGIQPDYGCKDSNRGE